MGCVLRTAEAVGGDKTASTVKRLTVHLLVVRSLGRFPFRAGIILRMIWSTCHGAQLQMTEATMHATQQKLYHPLTRARDAADRARLELLFPGLRGCPDPHFLALRPYAKECPQRFLDQGVHALMLDWLEDRDDRQPNELREYFASADAELSQAMLFLREVNAQDWHDAPPTTGDDFDLARFIDRYVHPTYLRLVEGVLVPFIQPVGVFMRLDRRKATERLDVYNLVQELASTAMAPCVDAYRHIVRNGIAHGGITYIRTGIRYRDKEGNEETLDVWSVIRLCDDMLDACNGLASALKLFLILSRDKGYRLPRELLVEELVEETCTPWWSIEGCVESELGNVRQLLVYARPNSRDFAKIQWASLQSAVMGEFFAPGYDRYFFSLRTPKAWPGWAAFDGKELKRLRESGAADIAACATAFEKGGLFYVPRPALPRFLGRLDTLLHSFRLQWPLAAQEIRQNLGIPSIVSRDGRMHRDGWRLVLNGSVVMDGLTNESAADAIRAHKRRIICKAAEQARSSATWLSPLRCLPLGYAHVAVFSQDFRRRRLRSFGLGPELICTVQLRRIRRIKPPDIMGSTIENSGNWRIAWNRAWIESGGLIGAPRKDP